MEYIIKHPNKRINRDDIIDNIDEINTLGTMNFSSFIRDRNLPILVERAFFSPDGDILVFINPVKQPRLNFCGITYKQMDEALGV